MFLEESTDALPLAEVFWLISHRQDWQDDKCTTNTWGEGGGGPWWARLELNEP